MRSMTQLTTETVRVPGAELHYDIRAAEAASGAPALVLIGSPMDAAGFATLAEHFPDRTVVTYDPRGVARSTKDDTSAPSTPEEHAEDVHRIIAAIGGGPVDVFGSSGGAVNALALVAAYPEDVRILVAHEPPAAKYVADSQEALAAVADAATTYQRVGRGPAMAKFIGLVNHRGPIPPDFPDRPVDPAMFGLPTEDDGTRDDPLLHQNLVTCTHFEPDFDALHAAPTQIVIAVGAESEGQLARRSAEGVAELLGLDVTTFPGDHAGFLGGEYGMTGEPEAFGAALRDTLAARG
jgi:pimeloyl-ACP methyl ester carboxylesterase